MKRIYLDNNATTSVDPEVVAAMVEDLKGPPANPSSVHYFGQEARNRLVKARQIIADYLHVRPSEIIFTSGGTEGMNQLLRSTSKGHIISSNAEHSCVYNTLKTLEVQGTPTSLLSVGKWGAVKIEDVKAALRLDTKLIALGAVNSETGVKTDLDALSTIALETGIPCVVDGVALLGKELFSIPPGIAAMAFSAHKFHGPKGIGFLFVRSSFKLPPLIVGGEQENGKRAGTENLPGILGMATAVQLLRKELPAASLQMKELRDFLEKELQQRIPSVIINGEGPRVVNTSNLCFPGINAETALMNLDLSGIAVSHGSACASGALEPSRVLLNMGISTEAARSSLRISLSRKTTREEIETFIETLIQIVKRLREKKR